MIHAKLLHLSFAAATAATLSACVDEADEADPEQLMLEVEPVPGDAQPILPNPGDPLDEPEQGCTLEARPAAVVSVYQSAAGDYVEPVNEEPTVLWRSWSAEDGWGPVQDALCVDEDCTRWTVGYGSPGYYAVGAFACGDWTIEGVEVGVTEDGCHVDTVHLPLVIDDPSTQCVAPETEDQVAPEIAAGDAAPANPELIQICPTGEIPNPSVIALTGVVQDDLFLPWQPNSIVSLHEGDALGTHMACLDAECTSHVDLSAWGQPGEFQVSALMCGEQIVRKVEVEASDDGCNVDTEWAVLSVDALTCNAATQAYETPQ